MATSKILLGPIPHARYDWVSGASYGKEAIVFHKGSSYIALSDNPSTEPSFTYDPATGSYNVSAGWGLLAVGTAIVQEKGDSQDKVMSQKAVTDALTASDQKLSELEGKVNGKQDALTLTVKDNGNIVIGNIQGQNKEFMPATPSGDPMHYAYVAAGAKWNGTGADIVKTTPWADLADDDADKTVVHKAGYWYLNGLGDITTKQMKTIYNNTISFGDNLNMNELLARLAIRTNFNKYFRRTTFSLASVVAMLEYNTTIEVIRLCDSNSIFSISDASFVFTHSSIKNVIGIMNAKKLSFEDCPYLRTIKIKGFTSNVSFKSSKYITIKSILYAINNEAATSAITITLHADAYARAMANADILAALEAHPNVSLASA